MERDTKRHVFSHLVRIMSKRTQKVKNCIDRMPSYPVHYAPFQRNGATNDVLAEHIKQQTKIW